MPQTAIPAGFTPIPCGRRGSPGYGVSVTLGKCQVRLSKELHTALGAPSRIHVSLNGSTFAITPAEYDDPSAHRIYPTNLANNARYLRRALGAWPVGNYPARVVDGIAYVDLPQKES